MLEKSFIFFTYERDGSDHSKFYGHRGNHRDFQTKYPLSSTPLALNTKPAFQSGWNSCNELFK